MVYANIIERLKPVDGCQHTLKTNSWDAHSDTVCPSCTLATRPDSPEKRSEGMMCSNCHTTTTPLWRRDSAGNTICNACGLYYKLHLVHRPVAMMRTVIKRRKRSEKRVKRQCKHEAKKDSFRGCATQPGSLSPTSQWEPCLSQPLIVLPPIQSLSVDPSLEQHVSRLTAYISSNVTVPEDLDTKEHQVACSLLSLAHAGRPFSDPSEGYPRLPPIQQGAGRIPTPSLPTVSLVAPYFI